MGVLALTSPNLRWKTMVRWSMDKHHRSASPSLQQTAHQCTSAVTADRRPTTHLPMNEVIASPLAIRDLEIGYTRSASSLRTGLVPLQARRLRCGLAERRSRRQAFYTNLVPATTSGSCQHNSGVVNEQGAAVISPLHPPTQTTWFRTGAPPSSFFWCGRCIAASASIARVLTYAWRNAVAERTRIARDCRHLLRISRSTAPLPTVLALCETRPADARRSSELELIRRRSITEGREACRVRHRRSSAIPGRPSRLSQRRRGRSKAIMRSVELRVGGGRHTADPHPIVRDEIIGSQVRRCAMHPTCEANQLKSSYAMTRAAAIAYPDDGKGIDPAFLKERGVWHFGLHGHSRARQLIAASSPSGRRRFWHRDRAQRSGSSRLCRIFGAGAPGSLRSSRQRTTSVMSGHQSDSDSVE